MAQTAGQAEGRVVEPVVTRLQAQRVAEQRRAGHRRHGRDDPAAAEGAVALTVVTGHDRDQRRPQEPLQLPGTARTLGIGRGGRAASAAPLAVSRPQPVPERVALDVREVRRREMEQVLQGLPERSPASRGRVRQSASPSYRVSTRFFSAHAASAVRSWTLTHATNPDRGSVESRMCLAWKSSMDAGLSAKSMPSKTSIRRSCSSRQPSVSAGPGQLDGEWSLGVLAGPQRQRFVQAQPEPDIDQPDSVRRGRP